MPPSTRQACRNPRGAGALATLAALLLVLASPGAARADWTLPIVGVRLLHQGVTTASAEADARDGVLRQRAELTCGPAALATLLTYHLGDPCTEDEIAKLAGTYDALGTSLLGLRNACLAKGFAATGHRWTLPLLREALARDGVPVIAHYREPLGHFVVVVSVEDDAVLVSDPESGAVTLTPDDFVRRWSGAVLVVHPNGLVDGARVARRRAEAAQRRRLLRDAGGQMGGVRL